MLKSLLNPELDLASGERVVWQERRRVSLLGLLRTPSAFVCLVLAATVGSELVDHQLDGRGFPTGLELRTLLFAIQATIAVGAVGMVGLCYAWLAAHEVVFTNQRALACQPGRTREIAWGKVEAFERHPKTLVVLGGITETAQGGLGAAFLETSDPGRLVLRVEDPGRVLEDLRLAGVLPADTPIREPDSRPELEGRKTWQNVVLGAGLVVLGVLGGRALRASLGEAALALGFVVGLAGLWKLLPAASELVTAWLRPEDPGAVEDSET